MIDPLAQIVGLLQPRASFSKFVTARRPWAVSPPREGPFYAALLEGEVELTVVGSPPVTMSAGDFVLIPATYEFTVAGPNTPSDILALVPTEVRPGVFHLGEPGEPDTRMLIGYCTFGANDAALLVSLLPRLVVVRGEQRLTTLVQLLSDEARAARPGRDIVLMRLLEVLLIEAFRTMTGGIATPGLLRGLADERVAAALRCIHGEPAKAWTVGDLAKEAALSRSTFFDRFKREVGVAPMEYLLNWRMALAKDHLRNDKLNVGQIAARVGYSSQSTFSVAFARSVGTPPMTYSRAHASAAQREGQ
ncbi:AraC family transcriptional regulator [Mesorhizobium sp. BR1-1-16]|uniref:AraC family transcriptional regulator n=1 Tax=Mesorhizobium sp. BR1-1-16 TaxID=2876653 RepID=UPI001CCADD82|nr:AraC family transcriptional regulator [Mesorhizobium sp. BR1-1-16]MBZ9937189.1 AraC family transcriptional regulator [Mesorhizobium sp. BR1-1-16]